MISLFFSALWSVAYTAAASEAPSCPLQNAAAKRSFFSLYPNMLPKWFIEKDTPCDNSYPCQYGIEKYLPAGSVTGSFLSEENPASESVSANDIPALPRFFDGREKGLVTDVKTQLLDDCWAFAFVAASESSLIKNALAEPDIDLSEAHLNYAAYKVSKKNLGFHHASTDGGSFEYALLPVSLGAGPVMEETAPYDELALLENRDEYILPDDILYSRCFAFDKYTTSGPSDTDSIKQLIQSYGGVCAKLYAYQNDRSAYGIKYAFETAGENEDPLQADSNSYMPLDIGMQNHSVEIIGWDDDYPASAFKTEAPGNGAFLCKNSWGSGDKYQGSGYLWCSYYDKTLGEVYGICYQRLNPANVTADTFLSDEPDIPDYSIDTAPATLVENTDTVEPILTLIPQKNTSVKPKVSFWKNRTIFKGTIRPGKTRKITFSWKKRKSDDHYRILITKAGAFGRTKMITCKSPRFTIKLKKNRKYRIKILSYRIRYQ